MSFMFADRLRAALVKEVEMHTSHITGGNISSFDDYKFKVGVLRGLATAVAEIDSLKQQLQDK